ncbi:hypothetical protein [Halobacillus sp. Nhm2S1]|uniref:hypothetical protein n=1 Tax=Halobacillus sp. Nhm2S1 TaxID=2866716 RepID=UPI001C73BC59|nr:hypothetical protein [Halobacillus sp. Nhm2S1]MBX0356721.1 hypothetical protein [Halobacillus sp. Nhm2S1]
MPAVPDAEAALVVEAVPVVVDVDDAEDADAWTVKNAINENTYPCWIFRQGFFSVVHA